MHPDVTCTSDRCSGSPNKWFIEKWERGNLSDWKRKWVQIDRQILRSPLHSSCWPNPLFKPDCQTLFPFVYPVILVMILCFERIQFPAARLWKKKTPIPMLLEKKKGKIAETCPADAAISACFVLFARMDCFNCRCRGRDGSLSDRDSHELLKKEHTNTDLLSSRDTLWPWLEEHKMFLHSYPPACMQRSFCLKACSQKDHPELLVSCQAWCLWWRFKRMCICVPLQQRGINKITHQIRTQARRTFFWTHASPLAQGSNITVGGMH